MPTCRHTALPHIREKSWRGISADDGTPPQLVVVNIPHLSLFILSQDPNGDIDSEVLEVHTRLQKKIPNEQIVKLQQEEFGEIIKKVKKHKEKLSHLYTLDEHGILKWIIRENNQKREVTVVPRELTRILLFEVHKILAHPGQLKMYLFLRRCYFWKNLRADVNTYVKKCPACNKVCLKEPKYVDFMTAIPQFPMASIAMDLLGPFLPTSRGNERILSCMDLLTHYLYLVPIKDKQAETVITAYTENIYMEVGGSHTLLSDKGSKFTAQTFRQIATELGLRQVFTSPRTPMGNGVLERAHSFVKNKLTRIRAEVPGLEWDEILPHVRFAYNVTPSSASGESPFYLFHGRDPYLPTLQDLLGYKMRYLGDDKNGLMIDALHVLYQEMMSNLVKSRQSTKMDIPVLRGDMFSIGDMVLLKDHTKEKLLPQYSKTYRVVQKLGDKTVDIVDQQGKTRRATFPQLIKVTLTEALLTKIPANLRYGRQAKYLKSNLPEVLKNLTIDTPVDRRRHSTAQPTSLQSQRSKPRMTATRLQRKSSPGSKNWTTITNTAWQHRLHLCRAVKS